MNRLGRAIMIIETPNVMRDFLEDIFTEKELLLCANKLKAADLLKQLAPYYIVEQETGLSSATVAKISKKNERPKKRNKRSYADIKSTRPPLF